MSSKPTLPTFEEITSPSVNELFAPPAQNETDKPFLDTLFVPPQPETYGRITPSAASVKPLTGKCRAVDDPARRWFAKLFDENYPLYQQLANYRKQLPYAEATKALRAAYTDYLFAEERAALNEQCSVVKSWRG